MWNNGDRVLAKRQGDKIWFPGTVRHFDGTRYYVIFDDSEDVLVDEDAMMQLQWKQGHQVFVHEKDEDEDTPALIIEIGEHSLRLQYPNGEKRWTPLKEIRVDPEQLNKPSFALQSDEWNLNDRVWACFFDLYWYPAIVLGSMRNCVHVLLDTGDCAVIPAERVRPFAAFAGDEIEGRLHGGRHFVPGKLTDVEGEVVHIHYEEGHEETTSIRLIRSRRDEWFPPNINDKWKAGARVLAQWYDLFWYPGIIVRVDGRRVQIAYDDGERDQALATLDQLQDLKIEEGMKVQCRYQNGPEFVPGEITKCEGERIFVEYADGREEWTTIRMVRVEKH